MNVWYGVGGFVLGLLILWSVVATRFWYIAAVYAFLGSVVLMVGSLVYVVVAVLTNKRKGG